MTAAILALQEQRRFLLELLETIGAEHTAQPAQRKAAREQARRELREVTLAIAVLTDAQAQRWRPFDPRIEAELHDHPGRLGAVERGWG